VRAADIVSHSQPIIVSDGLTAMPSGTTIHTAWWSATTCGAGDDAAFMTASLPAPPTPHDPPHAPIPQDPPPAPMPDPPRGARPVAQHRAKARALRIRSKPETVAVQRLRSAPGRIRTCDLQIRSGRFAGLSSMWSGI
jgi:hypothetical protein